MPKIVCIHNVVLTLLGLQSALRDYAHDVVIFQDQKAADAYLIDTGADIVIFGGTMVTNVSMRVSEAAMIDKLRNTKFVVISENELAVDKRATCVKPDISLKDLGELIGRLTSN